MAKGPTRRSDGRSTRRSDGTKQVYPFVVLLSNERLMFRVSVVQVLIATQSGTQGNVRVLESRASDRPADNGKGSETAHKAARPSKSLSSKSLSSALPTFSMSANNSNHPIESRVVIQEDDHLEVRASPELIRAMETLGIRHDDDEAASPNDFASHASVFPVIVSYLSRELAALPDERTEQARIRDEQAAALEANRTHNQAEKTRIQAELARIQAEQARIQAALAEHQAENQAFDSQQPEPPRREEQDQLLWNDAVLQDIREELRAIFHGLLD